MVDETELSRFTKDIQKFAFGIFSLILYSVFCAVMKYDGIIFQNGFIAISIAFLTAQAAVDWKKS